MDTGTQARLADVENAATARSLETAALLHGLIAALNRSGGLSADATAALFADAERRFAGLARSAGVDPMPMLIPAVQAGLFEAAFRAEPETGGDTPYAGYEVDDDDPLV